MTSTPLRRLVALGSAGLLVAGLNATLPAGSAQAKALVCTSGVPGDVNGDGYAEVAVSARKGDGGRGTVSVFYGQPKGLVVDKSGTGLNDQLIDQSWNYSGDNTKLTGFGESTGFGDFNHDGCADLVVGGGNAISVIYGTRKGLTKAYSDRFRLGTLYPIAYNLGESLAVGDFDRDGIDDVAVGAPGEVIGQGMVGAVVVAFGDGDVRLGHGRFAQVITANSPGLPGSTEDSDDFGAALAAGDFDGDGYDELAVGVPQGVDAGYVQVLQGSTEGFAGAQPERLTLNRPALPAFSSGSLFGSALAAGDANGDTRDDLLIGDPIASSTPESDDQSGAAYLAYGSASGLTAAGSQKFQQGVAGVPGTPNVNERFGSAVAMGPLDANGTADLAIGSHSDFVSGVSAGSVTLLFGGGTGVTTTGARVLHTDVAGIPGYPHANEQFGAAIATPHLQSKTQSTLVIGARRYQVGKHEAAGAIYQLPIGPTGPDASRTTRITADTKGVRGTAKRGLRFGSATNGPYLQLDQY